MQLETISQNRPKLYHYYEKFPEAVKLKCGYDLDYIIRMLYFTNNDSNVSSINLLEYYNFHIIMLVTSVVFSVTRMRSSNSARINKSDFTREKKCSAHMTMFKFVARHNVVNWIQLLT